MELLGRLRRPAGLAVAAAALLLAAGGPRPAAAAPTAEYAVKAAFLFNFTKFVQWPAAAFANPRSPLVLCVLGGRDPFEGELDRMVAGEVVGGRRLEVRRIRDPDDATACQLAFLPAREDEEWLGWLPEEGAGHRLLVGESDEFLRRGGHLRFALRGGRVRFAANLAALGRGRLVVSSKLLRLADPMPAGSD